MSHKVKLALSPSPHRPRSKDLSLINP